MATKRKRQRLSKGRHISKPKVHGYGLDDSSESPRSFESPNEKKTQHIDSMAKTQPIKHFHSYFGIGSNLSGLGGNDSNEPPKKRLKFGNISQTPNRGQSVDSPLLSQKIPIFLNNGNCKKRQMNDGKGYVFSARLSRKRKLNDLDMQFGKKESNSNDSKNKSTNNNNSNNNNNNKNGNLMDDFVECELLEREFKRARIDPPLRSIDESDLNTFNVGNGTNYNNNNNNNGNNNGNGLYGIGVSNVNVNVSESSKIQRKAKSRLLQHMRENIQNRDVKCNKEMKERSELGRKEMRIKMRQKLREMNIAQRKENSNEFNDSTDYHSQSFTFCHSQAQSGCDIYGLNDLFNDWKSDNQASNNGNNNNSGTHFLKDNLNEFEKVKRSKRISDVSIPDAYSFDVNDMSSSSNNNSSINSSINSSNNSSNSNNRKNNMKNNKMNNKMNVGSKQRNKEERRRSASSDLLNGGYNESGRDNGTYDSFDVRKDKKERETERETEREKEDSDKINVRKSEYRFVPPKSERIYRMGSRQNMVNVDKNDYDEERKESGKPPMYPQTPFNARRTRLKRPPNFNTSSLHKGDNAHKENDKNNKHNNSNNNTNTNNNSNSNNNSNDNNSNNEMHNWENNSSSSNTTSNVTSKSESEDIVNGSNEFVTPVVSRSKMKSQEMESKPSKQEKEGKQGHQTKEEQAKDIAAKSSYRLKTMEKDARKEKELMAKRESIRNIIYENVFRRFIRCSGNPENVVCEFYYEKKKKPLTKNNKQIEQAFKKLLTLYHPDKFVNKTLEKQIESEEIFKLLTQEREDFVNKKGKYKTNLIHMASFARTQHEYSSHWHFPYS